MLNSLKWFIFGSNCEGTSTETATAPNERNDTDANLVDADNLISVTSLTPSITGAIKSGKNKRNNVRQQNKRKEKQAKVLSPHNSSEDSEELDEDEWCIVEQEDEQQEATLARSDSEEENIPDIEVSKINKPVNTVAGNTLSQQRRHHHINSHSLYGGPRPQKQRNFLQKTRNNTGNRPASGLSVSTLSPSRTVHDGSSTSENETAADGGVTRSLCVTPSKFQINDAPSSLDGCHQMEGSWFITPPPCFTSVGPIVMETSPYENLLIEHPSMSVYHSIKRAQEAAESFVKLDISENEVAEKQKANESTPKKETKNSQPVSPRNAGSVYRLDNQSVTQLKQELMARNEQKVQIKFDRQDNSRSAIKRINKVREVQSRNNIQRRSDRQASMYCSYTSNNRKTNCY